MRALDAAARSSRSRGISEAPLRYVALGKVEPKPSQCQGTMPAIREQIEGNNFKTFRRLVLVAERSAATCRLYRSRPARRHPWRRSTGPPLGRRAAAMRSHCSAAFELLTRSAAVAVGTSLESPDRVHSKSTLHKSCQFILRVSILNSIYVYILRAEISSRHHSIHT